ncbi:LacI family DNA-binding transcriptional regulator [Brevibacterium sp.]|uniref:LacI family DNA-binding transcriptional regulator n=1 Tax=Brevibacterium sp. TaxID=1701 RepID=UPI0025C0E133|nr:LacI family DNA-binding transcriptional regulator [Brevibacterium sp.]
MTKRPTQEEVARIAGTSTAVVSYVLNNGPRSVSEDARRRVLAAIAKTGYRPNSAARALVSGRSTVIGLVVPDLANPFLAQLTQSLERELFGRGYSLLIGDSGDEPAREATVVETLLAQQVAGLVWYSVDLPPPLDVLGGSALPVVVVNDLAGSGVTEAAPAGRLISVDAEEYRGVRLATEHLLAHGRTRIAHLGGPQGRLNSAERSRGWADAVSAAGLSPTVRMNVPFTQEAGADAAGHLLESGCDAVVTANEMQATGLLRGLHRAGVRVPEDLSVVAYNGTPAAAFAIPSLTTVELQVSALAREIADALEPDSAVTGLTAASELVRRESCGCEVPAAEADA